jgi:dTDP-4-dehydrorhamnose 3,5-epimerase
MEIEVGEDNPCSVLVPPGVVHGYQCLSGVPALSINLPDKLYKGVLKQDEIDEIRWEQNPDSPYKIN